MLIDTHAHLDDRRFDADRDEVIRRAFENGVEMIVNIGAGLGSSARSVELAKRYDNIFASVGCHPDYFTRHGSWGEEHKNKLRVLAGEKKTVAIGEVGLDYFNQGQPLAEDGKRFQREGFEFQLELARELKKPVILHCRGEQAAPGQGYREEGQVYEDVLAIIKKYPQLRFVFHSFGGRLDFAQKVLDQDNLYFSFAGNITYNKPQSETEAAIKIIPLDRIMLDTDAPYLAPVPMRGQRNEPSFVKHVAEKIAEIKELPYREVAGATAKNARKFFNC